MIKRYKEYWISHMEKEQPIFFSEEEIKKYVRMFPQGTKVLIEQCVLDCCDQGHTFREIMGYDEWKH